MRPHEANFHHQYLVTNSENTVLNCFIQYFQALLHHLLGTTNLNYRNMYSLLGHVMFYIIVVIYVANFR